MNSDSDDYASKAKKSGRKCEKKMLDKIKQRTSKD